MSFNNSLRVIIRSSSEADLIAYVDGLKTPLYAVDGTLPYASVGALACPHVRPTGRNRKEVERCGYKKKRKGNEKFICIRDCLAASFYVRFE